MILGKLRQIINESYELVVVDDGSTDRTKEVAHEYGCQVIVHDINLGKGAAVQSGLRASRGERVIVIDGDDSLASVLPLR